MTVHELRKRSLGFVRVAAVLIASSAALIAFMSATAQGSESAVKIFQGYLDKLKTDRAQANWSEYLTDAQSLQRFLNGAPTSDLEVARADLNLHMTVEAAHEVQSFLDSGQVNPILTSPLFAPITRPLQRVIAANAVPVNHAKSAFSIEQAGVPLPEDIDYDASSQRFFISTIRGEAILVRESSGKTRVFATAPDHWPMVAIKIDAQRRRLWATEVAFVAFTAINSSDWGRSAILEYDLDSATLVSRVEGPASSNFGDLALAGNGDPIVSDGQGGGVYRLSAGHLLRLDKGEFISPQTVAVCPGDSRVFVPDYVRGLAALDLITGQVTWLSSSKPVALDGIDGLYCYGDSLIATQNGTDPQRIVEFHTDKARSHVTSVQVLQRLESGDYTHGVLIGRAFYFLAFTGWSLTNEKGELSGTKAPLPTVMTVQLTHYL